MLSNPIADECLKEIGSDKEKRVVEQRLARFAAEADVGTQGALDLVPPMRRMPSDLRHMRRMRIGRHRVYYTGQHTDCRYSLFYVKVYKKAGTDDEDDKPFQRRLAAALQLPGKRPLTTD